MQLQYDEYTAPMVVRPRFCKNTGQPLFEVFPQGHIEHTEVWDFETFEMFCMSFEQTGIQLISYTQMH